MIHTAEELHDCIKNLKFSGIEKDELGNKIMRYTCKICKEVFYNENDL